MIPRTISRRDTLKLFGAAAAGARVAFSPLASAAQQAQSAPSAGQIAEQQREDATRAARMAWWHAAKFGMFIHFGLYSVYGHHEWAMEEEGIPVAEYEQLAHRFQSATGLRARMGAARETRRPEIYGDDLEAPRGLLQFRDEAHELLCAGPGPRPRPRERIRRSGARRRPARRLLLFADGLAPSRWRSLRHRSRHPRAFRRLHARPDPRNHEQLRQNRRAVVRRGLASRRRGLAIRENERNGLRPAARNHRQQPQSSPRRFQHAGTGNLSLRRGPRLGILHDHERQLGISARRRRLEIAEDHRQQLSRMRAGRRKLSAEYRANRRRLRAFGIHRHTRSRGPLDG